MYVNFSVIMDEASAAELLALSEYLFRRHNKNFSV